MWFCLPAEDPTIGADDLWHDCHSTKVAQAMRDPMTGGLRNFAAEAARGGLRSSQFLAQEKCPQIQDARQQAMGMRSGE